MAGFLEEMMRSNPVELSSKPFKLSDFDDLLAKSDLIKRNHKFPSIPISEHLYTWIKEHPGEFQKAWMDGVKEFCELNGLT
jgi:hypothetical protein